MEGIYKAHTLREDAIQCLVLGKTQHSHIHKWFISLGIQTCNKSWLIDEDLIIIGGGY